MILVSSFHFIHFNVGYWKDIETTTMYWFLIMTC